MKANIQQMSALATLLLAGAAQATAVTVTGGTIAVSANAGENAPGDIYQIDSPTPATVAASGTTTLTANAAGTADGGFSPASASATGSVVVQTGADGATTITATTASVALPVHEGPGVWTFAGSSTADTVFFTLTRPESINANFGLNLNAGISPGEDISGTIQTRGGTVLFFSGIGPYPQSPTPTTLNLAAGKYEILSNSTFDAPPGTFGGLGDGGGIITVTFPAPVPLPGAAWLFLSGLGGFVALGRRRRAA